MENTIKKSAFLKQYEAIKEKYHKRTVNKKAYFPKVNFVRYADDFIVTGESAELLENGVKPMKMLKRQQRY